MFVLSQILGNFIRNGAGERNGFSDGREGADGIGNLADDGPSTAYVVQFGQSQEIIGSHITLFPEKGHGMTVPDEGIPEIYREAEVVGRRETPLSVVRHEEGEVLVVVVTDT